MTFEIGDKVETNSGLYVGGEWREAGLRGKIVSTHSDYYGMLTVKLKGIKGNQALREQYLTLRSKSKKEEAVPVEAVADRGYPYERFAEDESKIVPGATVVVVGDVETDNNYIDELTEGVIKSVDVAQRTAVVNLTDEGADFSYPDTLKFDEFTVVEDAPEEVKESPEVQAALNLILARIEEIVALLTTGPRQEFHVTVNEASFVTPEPEEEEAPEPEPVVKKAKEVKAGDSLYTEAGVWDKVSRVETKDSGYTSLFGVFGNKIVQVPSGRPLKVLEEVA